MSRLNIKEKAQRGMSLDDILVIDIHAHYGGYAFQEDYAPSHKVEQYTKLMISKMDKIGVDKICVSSVTAIYGDWEIGNNLVEEAVKLHPNRILGYYMVAPHYPESISIEKMDEYLNKPGWIGLKIHPQDQFVGYPNGLRVYEPVFEIAAEKNMIVLSHTWYPSIYCDPPMFGEIAESYPSVPIILGHAGGSTEGFIRSVETAKEHDNLYLELNNYNHHFCEIEYLVKSLGSSRILFGSDFATQAMSAHIGPILFAQISEDEKKDILGLNSKRLLERTKHYR